MHSEEFGQLLSNSLFTLLLALFMRTGSLPRIIDGGIGNCSMMCSNVSWASNAFANSTAFSTALSDIPVLFTYPRWLTAVMASTSVLAGGLVLTASYIMYKEPENKLWGFLITLGSLVSLLSIGGFGVGGVLGLIGGVMELSRRINES